MQLKFLIFSLLFLRVIIFYWELRPIYQFDILILCDMTVEKPEKYEKKRQDRHDHSGV